MDIINLEREKGITRCLMKSIPLRIAGLDSTSCYSYLLSHPNKEIVDLITLLHKAADHITNGWQKDMIKSMSNVGLTICCRHDKYKDILAEILTEISGKDVIIEKHKPFNALEKAMLNIVLLASDRIIKQRTYALDVTHELLSNCSNETVSFIHAAANAAMSGKLQENEYNRTLTMFEFLLYVAYLDTAYRDPFFWILDKMSRKEIRAAITKHVVDPFDWYVNIWVRSKKLTATQKAMGIIPPYEHSIVERRMVPSKQNKDLYKKK